MNKYISYFALLIAVAFYSCSNAQNTSTDSTTVAKPDKLANAYKFIEPNISVSYDSNFLKITQRYGSEFYDLSYGGDSAKTAVLYIKADYPTEYPPKKQRDSLLLAGIEEMKNSLKDSFSVVDVDKEIKEINGFSCVGIVGHDKIENKYSTFIGCYHFTDNDNTEISYFSKGNDLKMEYQILTPFLFGIKSYSQKEIDREESLIKSKYTIKVTPTTIDTYNYRPMTYIGFVSVNEKLEHQISEVRLTGSIGQEIFSPNEKGQVLILSNDNVKGNITKRGELVLLNSFGKKVRLPFTFTYDNKGPL